MKIVGVVSAVAFSVIFGMAAAAYAEQQPDQNKESQNKEEKVSPRIARQDQAAGEIKPAHELPYQPQQNTRTAGPEKVQQREPGQPSGPGRRDLQPAHELAHTVQQKGSPRTQQPKQIQAGPLPEKRK
jgi:hypothetical protein